MNRIKQIVVRAVVRVLRRIGFDAVRSSYYSPIPDVQALPAGFWDQRSALAGVRFDLDEQLDFARRELSPYLSELEVRNEAQSRGGYHLSNGLYEHVDAEVLHAVIRRFRPRNVIELGSGYSTLVISAAAARNRAEGAAPEHTVVDPFPSPVVSAEDELAITLLRQSATSVPPETFARLGAGDVLFVDTTHTVKVGSEVNHLVLEVLPSLRPGVLVHFHDVFLPWHYPREWIERDQSYWAEQYLLQAFLAFNDAYDVLFAAQALFRSRPAELRTLIPSAEAASRVGPGALWLRRRL